MDNASKALIMAGAILIAVALVGLGVYLFNSASDTVTNAAGEIDATKVETQNAKFEKYAGPEVKGPEVRALIRAVGVFNAKEIFPEPIQIDLTAAAGNLNGDGVSTMANNIDDRLYYEVTMTDYDAEDGFLTEITIDEL